MSLRVVNLSKRIEDTWALRDVSFEAARGEVFGIFGPTGAGKTTLLQLVAGTQKSNGGSIDEVASVVQPTVATASFWSRLFGANSTNNGDERWRSLDSAIATATDVLVLDEPLHDADSSARGTYIDKIRAAARDRGLTVLIASNDYSLILESCDRVAVLTRGEVRQTGTPQEVYEHPDSREVAYVTGRNNLFAARRLTSSKAEIPEFHTIDGGHRLFAQKIDRGALGALNQNVTLGIRPEQISISFGASFPADNLVKATVTGIRFLGATTLISLDADGLQLDALVLRVVGLNVGDECMVGLPPERILIFRD